MKRTFFSLLGIILVSVTLQAQSGVVSGPVDLDTTLLEIVQGRIAPGSLIHMVEVTVLGWTLSNEAPGKLDVILVTAQWEGPQVLRKYTAICRFDAETWKEVFPLGRARPSPTTVKPNETLLVAIRVTGQTTFENQTVPLLEGILVRKLN